MKSKKSGKKKGEGPRVFAYSSRERDAASSKPRVFAYDTATEKSSSPTSPSILDTLSSSSSPASGGSEKPRVYRYDAKYTPASKYQETAVPDLPIGRVPGIAEINFVDISKILSTLTSTLCGTLGEGGGVSPDNIEKVIGCLQPLFDALKQLSEQTHAYTEEEEDPARRAAIIDLKEQVTSSITGIGGAVKGLKTDGETCIESTNALLAISRKLLDSTFRLFLLCNGGVNSITLTPEANAQAVQRCVSTLNALLKGATKESAYVAATRICPFAGVVADLLQRSVCFYLNATLHQRKTDNAEGPASALSLQRKAMTTALALIKSSLALVTAARNSNAGELEGKTVLAAEARVFATALKKLQILVAVAVPEGETSSLGEFSLLSELSTATRTLSAAFSDPGKVHAHLRVHTKTIAETMDRVQKAIAAENHVVLVKGVGAATEHTSRMVARLMHPVSGALMTEEDRSAARPIIKALLFFCSFLRLCACSRALEASYPAQSYGLAWSARGLSSTIALLVGTQLMAEWPSE